MFAFAVTAVASILFVVDPPGALSHERALLYGKQVREARLVTAVGFPTHYTDVAREAREYLGYTQEQIADVLGLSRPAITLIESGERKVSAVELKKLAKLYQKPVDYFTFTDDDDDFRLVDNAVGKLVTTAIYLDMYLPDEDIDEVKRFAEFLAWRKRAKNAPPPAHADTDC